MNRKTTLCTSLTVDHQAAYIQEIRSQLIEQLKSLGERTETQIVVLSELEDYFRRRGEAEIEYSKQLDKLAKGVMQKHKTEKNKRDAWSQHAACSVWQQVVDDTREEGKQRVRLGELYAKTVPASISQRCDDLAKISKKCREIGALSHSEINRVLTELHTSMKTYQICYTEASGVEKKLRVAEEEVYRYEEAHKGRTDRRYKNLVKYLKKRQDKMDAVRTKSTKARNEYLLCVRAANAALHRFFAQDLSYLVDCMDLGMEFWLRSLLDQIIDARKSAAQREMESLGELDTLKSSLDSKADKQRFFEANHSTFMLPRQFEFRAQLGDAVVSVSAERSLASELAQRQKQIEKRLEGLRFESDEVWKSLEAAERQLFNLYKEEVEDACKWRSDVLVTYQYYLKKFEYFLLNGNLVERLEARSRSIGAALFAHGEIRNGETATSEERDKDKVVRKKAKRIGLLPEKPRPKLFGGSLEEYVDAIGEQIPLVVSSTIAFLSRFALRHQGLFRVSGSQSEINRFKEAFEKGEDPLAELTDGSEANSVAGVLKLYLRELREPIFPIYLFEQFTDCTKADSSAEFVSKTGSLIRSLPVCSILLLRVLFGFLSHLCEFADENMMEPHNLAICFGPTLLPIPDGKDQVFYHNFVNELVRALIVHHESIFPGDTELDGPVYNKYLIEQQHMDYADENDGLTSGDEDAVPSTVFSRGTEVEGEGMVDSTVEMSCSTIDREDTSYRDLAFRDVFRQLSSLQGGATPTECSLPPSSRSSNRSAAFDRRFSEDSVPSLPPKVESPNYVNHPTVSELSQRVSTHLSIGPLSQPGPLLTRAPVVSLREQLSHLKDRENSTRGGGHRVYPTSLDSVSKTSLCLQRLSAVDKNSNEKEVQNERNENVVRRELGDLRARLSLSSPLASDLRDELNKVLSEHEETRCRVSEQPDIVLEHRGGRAEESPTGEGRGIEWTDERERRGTAGARASPPFDELERAIQAVQNAHRE